MGSKDLFLGIYSKLLLPIVRDVSGNRPWPCIHGSSAIKSEFFFFFKNKSYVTKETIGVPAFFKYSFYGFCSENLFL